MAEKISEFTCLVRDMREAQKLYFDTRDKAYLKKAREIEKRVDDELQKDFRVDQKPPAGTTGEAALMFTLPIPRRVRTWLIRN